MSPEIIQGKILLINKPYTWTSFQALAKVRNAITRSPELKEYKANRAHNDPKFRIGHAGTLDPLATGLLIICTGRETKNIDSFMGLEKEYTGTFHLGEETASYDLESEAVFSGEINHITSESILQTAQSMLGEQMQAPPVFSAVKIDGKRAYVSARKGQDIEMPLRKITISTFEITRIELPCVDFRIVCSKGTYIRSIANDFGKKLQCGAYLEKLCRTRIGSYRIEDAITPEEFILSQSASHADSSTPR